MRFGVAIGLLGATVLSACSDSSRPRPREWHTEAQHLRVSIDTGVAQRLVVDTVRSVLAPAVEFLALTEYDPNHLYPVTAPGTGVVVSLDSGRHVRRGQMVGMIGTSADASLAGHRVTSQRDGVWDPRRQVGQVVWEGDTIGLVIEHGYGLAVGTVPDISSGAIHVDDPASVRFEDRGDVRRPGRVEFVRKRMFSVDVGVDFAAPEQWMGWVGTHRPATVTVLPAGPEDSVRAVPASAIAHLGSASAVFIPVAPGLYELRWVSPMVSKSSPMPIRAAIPAGTPVVTQGLERLVAAARDSLAVYSTSSQTQENR